MTNQLERQYSISTVSFFLFDGAQKDREAEDKLRLERYYHDLYALFMKKITAYCLANTPDDAEEKNLKVMLNEILAVRTELAKDL